jgi:RNA polymerase sigma factor (sigma-70 family)
MEPSDEALIGACRRGDEAAWDILVDRYTRLIFTIARRAGLDAEQSADVLQRVFTLLLEHLDSIAQPSRLSSWLTGTARREAWRVRRRERFTGATAAAGEALESLEDSDDLPEELVLRLEEQHRVRLALEALDGRCRQLLTMLFLTAAPPTYEEIAAAMKMRVGAVGPTRARCLQKLRQLLSDDE